MDKRTQYNPITEVLKQKELTHADLPDLLVVRCRTINNNCNNRRSPSNERLRSPRLFRANQSKSHEKIIPFFSFMLFMSCVSYKSFVTVTPRNDVPKGTTEVHIEAPMEAFLDALKTNGILYTVNESGAMTEEFLIDEGTRAKFTITDFDGTLRIIPYWGITDAVRQQQMLWVGVTTGYEMARVVYNRHETRPKQVFDYAVQIASAVGKVSYK